MTGPAQRHRISPKTRTLLAARAAWHILPKPVRYAFWEVAGNPVRRAYTRLRLARPPQYRLPEAEGPLVIAGLFRTASGIGEAARGTYRALKAAGLDPIAVDLSPRFAPMDLAPDIPLEAMPADRTGTLILQLNGPETEAGLNYLGMKRGRQWYTIGYWAWELPVFPSGWDRAFPFLSEIWTISDFTANALRQHADSPQIYVLGHGVCPPQSIPVDRSQFGWPKEAFIFLAMADSMSSFERKNPFAAIAAHKRAFGDDPSKLLIIKTRNLARNAAAEKDLKAAIGQVENIALLDASLSEDKRWELLNAMDALVSLHRAEGFGLVLAEAMALGKPVVTTGWSGNMDFTTSTNAYLVGCDLVGMEDRYGVYSHRDAEWAEPDITHAAEILKTLVEDASGRAEKIRLAKVAITERASQAALGKGLLARLEAAKL